MGNVSEEVQDEERRKAIDRRKLFALAASAAVGAVAMAFTGRAHAATGDALIIGQGNTADPGDITQLRATLDSAPGFFPTVFHVHNDGIPIEGELPPVALSGWSQGVAVHGSGGVQGVGGHSESGTGVFGGSNTGIGVQGLSESQIGVTGWSRTGVGVHGEGGGIGVTGYGGTVAPSWGVYGRGIDIGVFGESSWSGSGILGSSPSGIGVKAESPNGTALQVQGISSFNGQGHLEAVVDSTPGEIRAAFEARNFGNTTEGHHPIVAIEGYCPNGWGVSGHSDTMWGVVGHGPTGVFGRSDGGVGVFGDSETTGTGVDGHSADGVGVVGRSGGIGVRAVAESENGIALQVEGKSQCGADVVAHAPDEFPAAFHVSNHGTYDPSSELHPPVAIGAYCPQGVAVHGWGGDTGVAGESQSGTAVRGRTYSESGIGVHGTCVDSGVGVAGGTESGTGVRGQSDSGTGVEGGSGTGIGVHAMSETGTALQVDGKSVVNATLNHPGPPALEVSNYGEPGVPTDEGEWVWPASIVGMCEKGVGIIGYGEHQGVHGKTHIGTGVNGGSDSGTGVVGESNTGTGVRASSRTGTALQVEGKSNITANIDYEPALDVSNNSVNNGIGISAYSKSAPAVIAGSEANVGVIGMSSAMSVPGLPGEPGLPGVEGFSQFSFGVAGLGGIPIPGVDFPSADFMTWYTDPNRGTGGLLGYSDTGKGVVGFSDTGVGVLAISKGSPALRVEGKSSFSTVGSGTIVTGKDSFDVDLEPGLVTDKSHISVTLTSKPTKRGKGVAVSFIERHPLENRFEVHLTSAVDLETTFTYFIVEP